MAGTVRSRGVSGLRRAREPSESRSARRVRLDAQRADRRREHLVVPDEEDELDELAAAEVPGEGLPRLVGDVLAIVELVDRGEQRLLARRPAQGARPLGHAAHVLGADARAAPEADVVLEL